MNRRALLATLAALGVVLSSAVSLFVAAPASAATTQKMLTTYYGYYDNTPPGNDIAYPQIHGGAGGTGTWNDPITFASYTGELRAGTRIYNPAVKKYFIMEDQCDECADDWRGHGPNGGPNYWHVDLWVGGKGGNEMKALNCENALTGGNPDGTNALTDVIINPPSNEPVSSAPLFNTKTGECYGGITADTSIGRYKNASTGQCMDAGSSSPSSGAQFKVATCNGGPTQQLTFEGAFLSYKNLCVSISGSSVKLNTCTGGVSQQLNQNPDGSISDTQYGNKCLRPSGTSVVAGSCSGSAAQWIYTDETPPPGDFSFSVSPNAATVTAGSSTTATINTTITSGKQAGVELSASGVPAGVTVSFSPTAIWSGTSATMKVSVSSGAAAGTSTITVKGAANSLVHTATYSLTVKAGTGGGSVLLSQGQPITASSEGGSGYVAKNANDGSTSTRWASVSNVDPQWLRIDLGTSRSITQVKLIWDLSCAPSYQIQVSADGTTFTTAYNTTTGTGGTETINVTASGRYVRMFGTKRCRPTAGYSLQEMQVFGK